MSNFRGKSFAFVTSVVGAALMTGAVAAQTTPPAPAANAPAANAPPPVAAIAKRQKKPNKKVAPSIVVVVTNSRAVALTELDATPSGEILPKAIVSNLPPGKKISVSGIASASGSFPLSNENVGHNVPNTQMTNRLVCDIQVSFEIPC